MKHTPGPWRVGKPSIRNGVQIFWDSDWPLGSHVICTIPERGKGKTANARLIAAAPDLMEAAKAAIAMLSQNATLPGDIETAKQWLREAVEQNGRYAKC